MVALGVEKEEHVLRCTWDNITPVPQEPFITYILDKCNEAGEIDALVRLFSNILYIISFAKNSIMEFKIRILFIWHFQLHLLLDIVLYHILSENNSTKSELQKWHSEVRIYFGSLLPCTLKRSTCLIADKQWCDLKRQCVCDRTSCFNRMWEQC